MRIESVHARQILDSRGNPTLEVDVKTTRGFGRASVPSGASTGVHEAFELRDNGAGYFGKGVMKAVNNVNKKIFPKLKGMHVDDHKFIDEQIVDAKLIGLDSTLNKKRLGANAVLGVSMACARAGASEYRIPLYEYLGALYDNKKFELPIPFSNLINGGKHAGTKLRFQEFMVAPVKSTSFSEATRVVSEIYHELKLLLEKNFGKQSVNVGDEGGFAPPIQRPEQALDILESAVEESGYKRKVGFAMDAAASEFYNAKTKKYDVWDGKSMDADDLLDYYTHLTKKYNIISLEDPFHEDDYEGFSMITSTLSKKVQIVGDDLTVSNPDRIKMALLHGMCNSLLLKVNQIGTLTEAMDAAHLAQRSGWKVMVSHRSGETEDSFISDLAVGINAGQIKLGAPARGERTAKYNQLLRIEEELGRKAKYAKF